MTLLRPKALVAGFSFVAALTLVAGTAALGAPAKGGKDKPRVEKISLLYALNAGKGSLRPAGKGAFELTLGGLDREVVWFSDRPARRSGTFPTRGLVAAWKGFGFLSDPPNAALVYDDRTAVLELGPPRLVKGRISFRVRPVGRKRAGRNLSGHARDADPIRPGGFRNAALFIDNGQGMTVRGCLLEPFTVCNGLLLETGSLPFFEAIDLRGAKFTEMELGDSNFSKANLEGATLDHVEFDEANLSGANLKRVTQEGSQWIQTNLDGAELQNADLSNIITFRATANRALFRETDLSGAQLPELTAEEADFRGADLRGADLSGAKLWRANFGNAELAGANFEGASFNETILPGGWECNNRNGPQGCALPK